MAKMTPIGKGEDLSRNCPRCGGKGVEFTKIMRAPPPYENMYSICLWCPSCKRSIVTSGCNFVYTAEEVEKPKTLESKAMKRFFLPTRMKIDMHDMGEGKAELEYTEWPPKDIPQEAMENAMKMMGEVQKLDTNVDMKLNEDGSMTMRLTGPHQQVFDAIVGEFLCNSTLGGLTITELFVHAGLGAMREAKREPTKEVKGVKGRDAEQT